MSRKKKRRNSRIESTPTESTADASLGLGVLGNVLILLFPVLAFFAQSSSETFYYVAVQEDGALEWGTFWAFILAAVAFGWWVRKRAQAGDGISWLTLGLSLFCFVVAMEEISWGQRVLGYRPPDYFLRENFQQEFNVHNVFSTDFRKLSLKTVILGFGVVMPLLALMKPVRDLANRTGFVIAPLALVPSFLTTFFLYETYPWRFTGETVELMLGLGFLFAALPPLLPLGRRQIGLVPVVLWAFALTVILGCASFAYSHYSAGSDPRRVETARIELEALANDLKTRGRPESRCGVHKRVFSWAEKYRQTERLSEGGFASLTEQGLPEPRAEYFIDPWNTAYWIRHKCDDDRQVAFVYSFGPNRRRDSSNWEIHEDDVGVMLLERDK